MPKENKEVVDPSEVILKTNPNQVQAGSESKYARKFNRRRRLSRGTQDVLPFPVLGMEHRSDKAKERSLYQRRSCTSNTVRQLAKQLGPRYEDA